MILKDKKIEFDVAELDVKKIKNKDDYILCIILNEGKGSKWYWVNDKLERFSINNNTYFKVDSGTYVNGYVRFMVFLEGVSTPINHGYIEKEAVTKVIKNFDTGEDEQFKFYKIKGVNFDSKVIDILLNRHLADEFTKVHMDVPNLVIIILLVISVILGIVNIALPFFVKGT